MSSKTSYFNMTIFKKNLIRFMPLWAGYFVVCFLTFSLPLMNNVDHSYYNYSFILESARYGGAILPMIAAVITAICMWGYLYTVKSANFHASLPIKREGLFLTNYLSGLAGMTLVHTVIFIINLLLAAFSLESQKAVLQVCQAYLLITLNTVFFYGFATFCAMLTGNGTVLAVVYTLLNFTAVVVEIIIRSLLISCFIYGIAPYSFSGSLITQFLSPVVMIITGLELEYTYDANWIVVNATMTGWWVPAAYCAAGLVFAAAAFLLMKRRKMESATEVIAIRGLRPVFKYCFAAGCSIVLGSLMYSLVSLGSPQNLGDVFGIAAAMTIFLLIGALIGYYTAEMLLNKSVKVIKSGAGGYLTMAAVIIAVCLSLTLDLFGVARKVPEPGDVESVSMNFNYSANALLTTPENINAVTQLHKLVYEDRNSSRGYTTPIQINYKLKNGRELRRYYYTDVNEFMLEDKSSIVYKTMELMNSLEAINNRVKTDFPVNSRSFQSCYIYQEGMFQSIELTKEEALDLYNNCILPDASDGNICKVSPYDNWYFGNTSYIQTMYPVYIHYSLIDPEANTIESGRVYYGASLEIRVSYEAARTSLWLKNYGLDINWTERFDFDAYINRENATPSDFVVPSPAFTPYPASPPAIED